ncbi:MAG: gamma-glutamyl-gamma-aminobutyrate hydrolase family protein [Bacteroidales bacterium]|nr:gamma-glutamyl-gamma-aminobutyrate hydrolase family protein [Bacteroidales bacterium]
MKKLLSIAALLLVSAAIFAQAGKRPVIGISSTWGEGTSTSAPLTYVESVIRAGGVPLVLPITLDPAIMAQMLDRVDGLIMTGGEDIDPLKWFGEEPVPGMGEIVPARDSFDIALIRMAVGRGMPLLGICRGHQLLNVAFGGTLYQDIPSQVKGSSVKHSQKAPRYYGTHTINIEKGSLLNKQIGLEKVAVNSYHHQAVKDVAPGFKVTARSVDGIVEAMEKIGSTKVFSVQFHPEGFTASNIDTFLGIFQHLVKEAGKK